MLRRGFWIGVLAATLGSGGCGGSAVGHGGGHTLSGTTGGGDFVIQDAIIATTATWTSSPNPGDSTVIILSNRDNLCGDIEARQTHTDSRFVLLYLAEVGTATMSPITAPGDYPLGPNDAVVPPTSGFAFYAEVDAQCAATGQLARSGTVTLSTVGANGTSASGRLAVVFEDGSTLLGDFSATAACPNAAVDAYLSATPPPTCS
jgi:hypothetical protein